MVAIPGTTATPATITAAIRTMGMAITIARAGATTTMATIIIAAGATSITIAATIITIAAVEPQQTCQRLVLVSGPIVRSDDQSEYPAKLAATSSIGC